MVHLYFRQLGTGGDCHEGVLISGVEALLYQSIVNYLVPVACVHNRGVSAIQGLD